MGSSVSSVTPCFTPGTLIATDRGQRPIEALRRGDLVVTRDNGLQRVYWCGRRDVGFSELIAEPELQPVLIRADAFAEGSPSRDMIVSPAHRFLVGPGQTQMETGGEVALIAARHLIDRTRIMPARMLGVSYLHLLCARHEIVLADGVWTESFHPDDRVMQGIGNRQRLELLGLFPEIATIGAAVRFPPARRIVGEGE